MYIFTVVQILVCNTYVINYVIMNVLLGFLERQSKRMTQTGAMIKKSWCVTMAITRKKFY